MKKEKVLTSIAPHVTMSIHKKQHEVQMRDELEENLEALYEVFDDGLLDEKEIAKIMLSCAIRKIKNVHGLKAAVETTVTILEKTIKEAK